MRKGIISGTIIGLNNRDIRNLDYSSCAPSCQFIVHGLSHLILDYCMVRARILEHAFGMP